MQLAHARYMMILYLQHRLYRERRNIDKVNPMWHCICGVTGEILLPKQYKSTQLDVLCKYALKLTIALVRLTPAGDLLFLFFFGDLNFQA